MPRKDVASIRSLSVTSQESDGVILADLIADVPLQEAQGHHRTHADPHSKAENGGQAPEAKGPANTMETVNVGQTRAQNGTSDISKGVILSAYLEQDLKNGKSEKLQLDQPQQQKGPPEGISFRDMSPARKVAFGLSFLPSIMFVLCFAVILPCQKRAPCVDTTWTRYLNNTRVMSPLMTQNPVLSFKHQDGVATSWGLMSLDSENGNTIWSDNLEFEPLLVGCAPFSAASHDSCLIFGPKGAFQLYNASNGQRLLDGQLKEHQSPTRPVILPSCGGLASFASSVAAGVLEVVGQGEGVVPSVSVPDCESPPVRLTAWTRGNQTDIVLLCRNGKNDALIRVPHGMWCQSEKRDYETEKSVKLNSREAGVLSDSVFLPTEVGLLAWTGNELSLFDPDGYNNWTASTLPHAEKNRFLLHGKFKDGGEQIALFSSDNSTQFLVTLLSFEKGDVMWNSSLANVEVSDISVIHGENKDFVLLNTRKRIWDPTKQAVQQLSGVPTSLLNMLTDDGEKKASSSDSFSLSDEMSFLELGGTGHPVYDEVTSAADGEFYQKSLTVLPVTKEGLDVIMTTTPSGSDGTSTLKKIRITNWDISLPESKSCEMK